LLSLDPEDLAPVLRVSAKSGYDRIAVDLLIAQGRWLASRTFLACTEPSYDPDGRLRAPVIWGQVKIDIEDDAGDFLDADPADLAILELATAIAAMDGYPMGLADILTRIVSADRPLVIDAVQQLFALAGVPIEEG